MKFKYMVNLFVNDSGGLMVRNTVCDRNPYYVLSKG